MKIPKSIRQAIKDKLATEQRPLGAGVIADAVNNAQKYQRTPRQMSFILKKLAKEGEIKSVEISKNGINRHGNARVRCEYIAVGADDTVAD